MQGSLTETQVNQITNSLRGSCEDFDRILLYFSGLTYQDLTDNDLTKIYGEVNLCDLCGWWDDASEFSTNENGDIVCNDCT